MGKRERWKVERPSMMAEGECVDGMWERRDIHGTQEDAKSEHGDVALKKMGPKSMVARKGRKMKKEA